MNVVELQRWFLNHVTLDGKPYALDEEQAAVVLDEHKNAIVTARAGSGKTRTLIAKITYLIALKHVPPEKILALGFYHEPQCDFERRLLSVRVDGKPICNTNLRLARTFHSLACDFSRHDGAILKNEEHDARRNRYIREILDRAVDPKNVYAFVRDDSHEPKRDDYNNDRDYYSALKYTRYETLDGNKVKSRCEKIICDYLFEHDVDFKYERFSFYPKHLSQYAISSAKVELEKYEKITPDFILEDKNGKIIIWEHWGISGNETEAEKIEISKSGVIGNYYDYKDKQEFKEWFYDGKWLDKNLIQTKEAKHDTLLQNFLDIKGAIYTHFEKNEKREDFEQKIEAELSRLDIKNKKLSEGQLLANFKNIVQNIESNASRVQQFIDRAEQQFPNNYEGLMQACKQTKDLQVKKFYDVCLMAYDYYLKDLTKKQTGRLIDEMFPRDNYRTDYSIVLNDATQKIQAGANGKNIKIEDLEYIFLDEYQDFSLLFLNLVQAICKRNKNIRILAVGDNWQAISSFAGASLEYFDNFEKYFPEDVIRLKISTNYRSTESIVEAANTFMKNSLGDEDGARAQEKAVDDDNAINDCTLSDVHNYYNEQFNLAKENLYKKYQLILAEIIKDNAGKSIRFLNRTHDFKISDGYKEDLARFETIFKERYQKYLKNVDFENKLTFATVNTSKGLEADVVILLESDIGRFPIFHPDNYLYEVFGDTEQKALDEQKRLFYVAITRAKEKIYILHTNNLVGDDASDKDFLKMMELDNHPRYQKESFLSLETKIKHNGVNKRVKIDAIKIRFAPDRYRPESYTITILSKNGDVARQFSAKPNYSSARQLKPLESTCSKEHPVTIYASATPSGRYPKQYINFYDSPS